MPSKAEEIKILSAAAKKLGNDSYLGPALLHLIPHLEMEIRSDFCPDLLGLIRDKEAQVATLTADCKKLQNEFDEKKRQIDEMEKSIRYRQNDLDQIDAEIYRAKQRAADALGTLKSYLT